MVVTTFRGQRPHRGAGHQRAAAGGHPDLGRARAHGWLLPRRDPHLASGEFHAAGGRRPGRRNRTDAREPVQPGRSHSAPEGGRSDALRRRGDCPRTGRASTCWRRMRPPRPSRHWSPTRSPSVGCCGSAIGIATATCRRARSSRSATSRTPAGGTSWPGVDFEMPSARSEPIASSRSRSPPKCRLRVSLSSRSSRSPTAQCVASTRSETKHRQGAVATADETGARREVLGRTGQP